MWRSARHCGGALTLWWGPDPATSGGGAGPARWRGALPHLAPLRVVRTWTIRVNRSGIIELY